MNLIPTPVVDKNGRATTVHKRSGSAAVSTKKLAAIKPVGSRAAKKTKVDEPFSYTVHKDFALSRFGIILNELRPELALDRNSLLKDKSTIEVTSRDVYSLARHGLIVRDCIYLAHFKITPDEAIAIAQKLATMEHDRGAKVRPRPWIDHMIAADIDHRTLLAAYENGLTADDLHEMPPENAVGTIMAYNSKTFSKTDLIKYVRDGKVSWDDIKKIGATRAAKYEWTIWDAMTSPVALKKGDHELTYDTLGDIIRDAEKKQRTRFDDRAASDVPSTITLHSALYRMVGEKFWDFHVPEIIDRVSWVQEARSDLLGYAAYCDEVIHKVRSEPGVAESIIEASGGKSKRNTSGTYEGQYPEQRDPAWKLHELVEYRRLGLSVDECITALQKGLSPDRAKGVMHAGIALPVSEGWL
jgi:hypothetical protein